VTYLHPDHLGTPKFGTNAGGTQVWAWAPDAFGNGSPSGAATVNLRMPGQFYDAESSLFYNWNRYYNPATGRYISSDPIGLEGGINTFLYAAASPVMMVDPEGLDSGILALEFCARNPAARSTAGRALAASAAPVATFCTTTPVGWVTCGVGALAAAGAICYATLANDDHSVEICKEICYTAYEDSSRICTMMKSAENRHICWAEAAEQLAQCNKICEGK